MKNLFKAGKLKLWQKYCEIQRKKHPLTYLFWECSLRCNLSCQHCGSSCGPERINKDELTTEEIKNVFCTIAEDFNPKQIMVAVTGGEPLLRKDIFEVMGYANELGFSWGMVTNGTLITPEIVNRMKEAKMSTISVSLDGLENNHNWLRNSKDVFKRTINGIKLLVSSKGFDIVEAISCINQNNFNELEEIYQLCNNLGVDKWRIFTISPIGRAKGNSKLFLDSQQLHYLLKYIKDKRREKKNKPEVSFCDEGFLGLDYEGEVRDQLFYCWAGISVGSILYNGDVAACPILPREHTRQGNIRQDRFSEIWNNKYELFRDRNWRKCADCKNCSWWEFCEGNSLHLWDFDNNKLTLCNCNLINQERSYQNKEGKKKYVQKINE